MSRLVLLFVLAFPATLAAQAPAAPSKAVARYLVEIEKLRAAKVAALEAELTAIDASDAGNKQQQADLVKKKLERARHPRAIYRPAMPASPTDQHTGFVGELSDRQFTVAKVIDEDEMFVTFKYRDADGRTTDGQAVLKGVSTQGKLPEKAFDQKGVFEYAGRDERRHRAPIFVLVDQRAIDSQLKKLRDAVEK